MIGRERPEQDGLTRQALVATVMAALSEDSRCSAHPADLRGRQTQAFRIVAAIEAALALRTGAPDGAVTEAAVIPSYE
ncbi:hypothetical protein [Acidisoma sp. 7E03]